MAETFYSYTSLLNPKELIKILRKKSYFFKYCSIISTNDNCCVVLRQKSRAWHCVSAMFTNYIKEAFLRMTERENIAITMFG